MAGVGTGMRVVGLAVQTGSSATVVIEGNPSLNRCC